jgi:hypothetical protein
MRTVDRDFERMLGLIPEAIKLPLANDLAKLHALMKAGVLTDSVAMYWPPFVE